MVFVSSARIVLERRLSQCGSVRAAKLAGPLPEGAHGTEFDLRLFEPLLGRLAEPPGSCGFILRHAEALGVHGTKKVPRLGVPKCRQRLHLKDDSQGDILAGVCDDWRGVEGLMAATLCA